MHPPPVANPHASKMCSMSHRGQFVARELQTGLSPSFRRLFLSTPALLNRLGLCESMWLSVSEENHFSTSRTQSPGGGKALNRQPSFSVSFCGLWAENVQLSKTTSLQWGKLFYSQVSSFCVTYTFLFLLWDYLGFSLEEQTPGAYLMKTSTCCWWSSDWATQEMCNKTISL